MRKSIVTVAICLLSAALVRAEKVRISILFVHYSVGTQIVEGYCWDDQYRRIITEALDTMTVAVDTDTARIVFRSYRMNDDPAGFPLSDTLPMGTSGSEACAFDRFQGFDYDFYGGNHNRMRIWNSDYGMSGNAFAGLLDQFFCRPDKEDSVFWRIFQTHEVPSSFPEPVTEVDGFDPVSYTHLRAHET